MKKSTIRKAFERGFIADPSGGFLTKKAGQVVKTLKKVAKHKGVLQK